MMPKRQRQEASLATVAADDTERKPPLQTRRRREPVSSFWALIEKGGQGGPGNRTDMVHDLQIRYNYPIYVASNSAR